jgi:hypothetical protein
VSDARDERLRRLSRWLAFSERLDRLIEASEAPAAAAPPAHVRASTPAPRAQGVRAGVAAGLARVAVALHREAAADAVAGSPLEGQAEGQA